MSCATSHISLPRLPCRHLLKLGYMVAAHDLPSHRRSVRIGGIRTYVNKFDEYAMSLEMVLKYLQVGFERPWADVMRGVRKWF